MKRASVKRNRTNLSLRCVREIKLVRADGLQGRMTHTVYRQNALMEMAGAAEKRQLERLESE